MPHIAKTEKKTHQREEKKPLNMAPLLSIQTKLKNHMHARATNNS